MKGRIGNEDVSQPLLLRNKVKEISALQLPPHGNPGLLPHSRCFLSGTSDNLLPRQIEN